MLERLFRSFRRLRYGKPVVVISGLPRSGTSMAMKMLEAGGMPLVMDGIRSADEDNPRGYFEDERVKDLAQVDDKSWLYPARGRAIKIISYLLKELPQDLNYRIVFMRRNLHEVLASQTKMLERRGEENESSDERMLEIYEDHLWKVGYLLKNSPHFEVLELDYRQVLEQPEAEALKLQRFLGEPLDLRKMVEVVDPSLYRNRAPEDA